MLFCLWDSVRMIGRDETDPFKLLPDFEQKQVPSRGSV